MVVREALESRGLLHEFFLEHLLRGVRKQLGDLIDPFGDGQLRPALAALTILGRRRSAASAARFEQEADELFDALAFIVAFARYAVLLRRAAEDQSPAR